MIVLISIEWWWSLHWWMIMIKLFAHKTLPMWFTGISSYILPFDSDIPSDNNSYEMVWCYSQLFQNVMKNWCHLIWSKQIKMNTSHKSQWCHLYDGIPGTYTVNCSLTVYQVGWKFSSFSHFPWNWNESSIYMKSDHLREV